MSIEPGQGPAGWVKRDPTEEELDGLLEYISTETGFLELVLEERTMNRFSPTGVWEWDPYQGKYFNIQDWFICNKCRQSGGSAMLSAKAFARGILAGNNFTAVLTSYKKEEAVNKIDYVRQYLEALPPKFRKEIIRDPLQLIEFQNVNGTRTKIMSHAQKPIRGVAAHFIGLDELAFYQWAEEIYASALPAVGMVQGTVDIISTPFGMSGKFYEIFSDVYKFPDYKRLPIMWWICRRYLKYNSDEFMIKALKLAPYMTTEERVMTFGNKSIQQQFENAADLETFRQEFEGLFVDEQAAFFTKDLITSCMYPEWTGDTISDLYNPKQEDFRVKVQDEWVDTDIEHSLSNKKLPIEEKYENRRTSEGKPIHFRKYKTLNDLYVAIKSGKVSRNIFAGIDIGVSRHSTHVILLEEVILDDGETLQIERFSLNRQKWALEDQQAYFNQMLLDGFIMKMYVDTTGIGHQLGQTLKKQWGEMFIPFHMGGSNSKQESLMVNLKNRMSRMTIALEYDRRTIEDLYAIHRVVRDNRSIGFKADEKKRHHADAAWAIALASIAGTPAGLRAGGNNLVGANMPKRDLSMAHHGQQLFGQGSQIDTSFSLLPTSKKRKQFAPDWNPGVFISDYDD